MKVLAILLLLCASALAVYIDSPNADCDTWYETTAHGSAFRNVKTYGAKGDGTTDDTNAILAALTEGRRDIYSTKQPAVVYFPPGNYKVSKTLPLYGYTHIIGNYACRPKIFFADNSRQGYLISATRDNSEHTDNFYHQIHHVNLDLGQGNGGASGIHWAVAQGTSIRNVTINVNSGKLGVFCENGGGGFIGDLEVIGGDVGLQIGGQQFAFRSITIRNTRSIGFQIIWDWAFSILDLNIYNTPVGIQFTGGAVDTVTIVDSTFTQVQTAVKVDSLKAGVLFDRVTFTNVNQLTPNYAGNANGVVKVASWRQGLAYSGGVKVAESSGNLPVVRPDVGLPLRPRSTFGPAVHNARDSGAKGDGTTDDTAAIQSALTKFDQVFLPYGTYLVSDTISLKTGNALIGEGFSIILAKARSPAFSDANNPKPLILTPAGADSWIQLADLTLSVEGELPGLIFVEWRSGVGSSLWDVHYRILFGTWGLLHLSGAGAGVIENTWLWVADHDIDAGGMVNITNPRGLLIESSGPTYLYGTAAEHSSLYQYNFTGASNIYTILTQTEIPYWIDPVKSIPLIIHNSANIFSYGSGYYTWFHGANVTVGPTEIVQSKNVNLYGNNVHNYKYHITGDHSIGTDYSTFCSYFISDVPY